MRNHEKETAQTLVKKRGAWQVSRDTNDSDGTVNSFTMFVIGAAAFFAGFWALACLANAFFNTGPLDTLGQLAVAVTGR